MAVSTSRITSEVDFLEDGKHSGYLRLPHSVHRSAYGWLPIPITCIRNGEGPRVLLMAGNHGDEYEGQVALCELIRQLQPEQVRGRIIIMPMANYPAALAGTRTSPLDEGNLNRSFPGNPDGGPTQMIAHFIESVLLSDCDYFVDLHSGGSSLHYLPTVCGGRRDDPVEARQIYDLMKVFGAPYGFIFPRGREDRVSTAASARKGVVSLLTELGGSGTVTPEILAIARRGLRRVLAHVGSLRDPEPELSVPLPVKLTRADSQDWFVHASADGVWEPLVELGDEVVAGQPAALIHTPETPWREPAAVSFRAAGIVICKRIPARTERGDCLFHLGTEFDPAVG
jgi:uncharacterized protein